MMTEIEQFRIKSKGNGMHFRKTALTLLISAAILVGCGKKTDNSASSGSNSGQPGMKEIISKAKMWGPVFPEWVGKEAPDFSVTDISGKKLSLSDYSGKDVIVVFWATWCPPCKMEIPHLKELRDEFSTDQLEILAISNEPVATVKPFAEQEKLNYTVATTSGQLPAPFGKVQGIPTSFYIDKQGMIKLAPQGVVSTEEAKNILNAK